MIVVDRKVANESHQAHTLTRKRPRPETKETAPSVMKTRPMTVASSPVCGNPDASPERPATPSSATPRNVKRTPQVQEKRDMTLTEIGRFEGGVTASTERLGRLGHRVLRFYFA